LILLVAGDGIKMLYRNIRMDTSSQGN